MGAGKHAYGHAAATFASSRSAGFRTAARRGFRGSAFALSRVGASRSVADGAFRITARHGFRVVAFRVITGRLPRGARECFT